MTTRTRGHAASWRWETPEHHATIDSTNTRALADPRPGRVVVSDHQSAGQGRRGRTWDSPAGTGMAITAVLPPLPSAVLGWVPLVGGLAVARALAASRWPLDAVLKWPNDVLVETGPHPGKLCGVLARLTAGDGGRPGPVVLGAGLNVDHAVDQLPVPTATSWRLARGGAPVPAEARETFLEDYLHGLADLHDALAAGDVGAVRTAYQTGCRTLGRQVALHLPDGTRATGRAVGLAVDGALLLEGPDGTSTHHAGDVEHLRAE